MKKSLITDFTITFIFNVKKENLKQRAILQKLSLHLPTDETYDLVYTFLKFPSSKMKKYKIQRIPIENSRRSTRGARATIV